MRPSGRLLVAMERLWLLAGSTVTEATACALESALLVAVIETLVALATAGAVKVPLELIEPAEAVQVTAVLSVPVTAAVKFCVWPESTLVFAGETAT